MYNTKTLAVVALAAGAATAIPAPQASTPGPTFVSSDVFGLKVASRGQYTNFNLRIEPSDIDPEERTLLFMDPATSTPSPAYLNGTSDQLNGTQSFAYLNFIGNAAGQAFGVSLPEIGDGRGFVESIDSSLGPGTPSFNQKGDNLAADKAAAPNQLVACPITVNSTKTPAVGLRWANVDDDGSLPGGCSVARLELVPMYGPGQGA